MGKLKCLFFAMGFFFFSAQVWAKNLVGKTVREKELRIDFSSGYFYKTATFDVDGNAVNMNPSEEFYLLDNNLFVQFGFAPNFEMFEEKVSHGEIFSENVELTNTNIESYHLGNPSPP